MLLALLLFLGIAAPILFPKGVKMGATWDLWGPYEKEPENSLDFFSDRQLPLLLQHHPRADL